MEKCDIDYPLFEDVEYLLYKKKEAFSVPQENTLIYDNIESAICGVINSYKIKTPIHLSEIMPYLTGSYYLSNDGRYVQINANNFYSIIPTNSYKSFSSVTIIDSILDYSDLYPVNAGRQFNIEKDLSFQNLVYKIGKKCLSKGENQSKNHIRARLAELKYLNYSEDEQPIDLDNILKACFAFLEKLVIFTNGKLNKVKEYLTFPNKPNEKSTLPEKAAYIFNCYDAFNCGMLISVFTTCFKEAFPEYTYYSDIDLLKLVLKDENTFFYNGYIGLKLTNYNTYNREKSNEKESTNLVDWLAENISGKSVKISALLNFKHPFNKLKGISPVSSYNSIKNNPRFLFTKNHEIRVLDDYLEILHYGIMYQNVLVSEMNRSNGQISYFSDFKKIAQKKSIRLCKSIDDVVSIEHVNLKKHKTTIIERYFSTYTKLRYAKPSSLVELLVFNAFVRDPTKEFTYETFTSQIFPGKIPSFYQNIQRVLDNSIYIFKINGKYRFVGNFSQSGKEFDNFKDILRNYFHSFRRNSKTVKIETILDEYENCIIKHRSNDTSSKPILYTRHIPSSFFMDQIKGDREFVIRGEKIVLSNTNEGSESSDGEIISIVSQEPSDVENPIPSSTKKKRSKKEAPNAVLTSSLNDEKDKKNKKNKKIESSEKVKKEKKKEAKEKASLSSLDKKDKEKPDRRRNQVRLQKDKAKKKDDYKDKEEEEEEEEEIKKEEKIKTTEWELPERVEVALENRPVDSTVEVPTKVLRPSEEYPFQPSANPPPLVEQLKKIRSRHESIDQHISMLYQTNGAGMSVPAFVSKVWRALGYLDTR